MLNRDSFSTEQYRHYAAQVSCDVEQLKRVYPWTRIIYSPSSVPTPIQLSVTAVSKDVMETLQAREEDFLAEYSKSLQVTIPFDYERKGCEIYGAGWLNIEAVPQEDRHFFGSKNGLHKFCLGVPASFAQMKNVILENIKTADNMLVAYELFQKGINQGVNLIAYSHGKVGEDEYAKDKKKYKSK
ncbi:MAG: hypothetical protein IJX67_00015 [Oscillospiraceae bacterium]|nr:hypothetical protein [Oscillospiraceae bacterium]